MEKLLKLLLLAAFFNGVAWIILIPLWQYPDEQAHFAQVQGIAETGKLPTTGPDTFYEIALSEKILGTERDGFGNNKYTYHPEYNIEYSDNLTGLFEAQISNLPKSARTDLVKDEATHNPPLYYFLGSLSYKIFYWENIFTRVFSVRFISLALFIILVFTTYKIGRLLFEINRILALSLPTLVAFKPMLVFASTGVLPDPLTNLLFTLILYLGVRVLKYGLSLKDMLIAGVVLVLGFYTRQQFLIALPIILGPALYKLPTISRLKIIIMSVFFITATYIGSYYIPAFSFIKNFGAPDIENPNLKLIFTSDFLNFVTFTIKKTITQTLPWYWGVYRWLSFTLDPIIYQIINRLVIISFIGILIRIIQIIKNKKIEKSDILLIYLILTSIFYFSVFLIWDYFFQLNFGYSFGVQGRYFFPLVVAHLAILLTGLCNLFEFFFKKYSKFLLLTIILSMIMFNNISLVKVSTSYYEISDPGVFIIQSSQYKPQLFKGITILLIVAVSITTQVILLLKLTRYTVKLKS